MKLLCSVLILAGVFALNDASNSIPFEYQMRLAQDQMMLEDLKRMPMDRDVNSLECSQKLLDNLTRILGIYNEGLNACNRTKVEEMTAIQEDAKKAIEVFSSKMQNTCETLYKCGALDEALDTLSCYEEESSQSAQVCTSVSNDASTEKVGMRARIETCEGNEKICSSKCLQEYSEKSMQYNSEFKDCVNGKQSSGEKPSDAPPTTEAPQESSSTPAEEEEGQGENGRRRPKSANKYSRF